MSFKLNESAHQQPHMAVKGNRGHQTTVSRSLLRPVVCRRFERCSSAVGVSSALGSVLYFTQISFNQQQGVENCTSHCAHIQNLICARRTGFVPMIQLGGSAVNV